MIVLDAGVVIATLAVDDVHSESAAQILGTIEELGIHPVNLGESLVHSARRGDELTTSETIADIGIVQVSPRADQPVVLARLRVRTGLRMPDCCVLAAALETNATVATFDRRLADAARDLGLSAVGA